MKHRFPLALPDRIAIHHSASARSTTFAQIERWHVKDRGWPAVGYHEMINAAGNRKTGRVVLERGSAVARFNTGTLSIMIMGNNTKPSQRWTQVQVDAARRIVDAWVTTWPHLERWISGHRDVARKGHATACPGVDIRRLAEVDWCLDTYWKEVTG